MSESRRRNPTPVFAIGLFFGILIGAFVTFLLTSEDRSEPVGTRNTAVEPARRQPSTGDRPHGVGRQDMVNRVAAYHLMKHFLDALTKEPTSKFPAPDYSPLLEDPARPITLEEFDGRTDIDYARMLEQYPVAETLARFRRAKNRAMIPAMRGFVAQLNGEFGDRLRKPVACTDCHFLDPSDAEVQIRVFPPLMVRFLKALTERPKNQNPAQGWKPLLKDGGGVRCASCHATTGQRMEQMLDSWDLSRPPEADNTDFMIRLMEEWVEKLNRVAGDRLTKAVVCLDCHDTDPRR